MHVRKEQREINPFQMLTFSEKQVNPIVFPSIEMGNSRKNRFALKPSAVNLNKVVFKKPSEIHYTTTKTQQRGQIIIRLSGRSSLARYRTILNHTDHWFSTSPWPTHAFKTNSTACGHWTRHKFLWPLDVPVPPPKHSCGCSFPSLHIMEL